LDACDFLIIGAGAAGCVLANRLTADGRHRVVLVEAGPPARSPLFRIPLGVGRIRTDPTYFWNFESDPQPNLASRRLRLAAGRVVGGSSAINGMVHTRAPPADYDHWRELGNPGWSHADLLFYFQRAETPGEGLLHVAPPPPPTPLTRAFLAAARQAGHAVLEDLRTVPVEGFGAHHFNIRRGRRSTGVAYLHAARRRSNLTVIAGARARRLVFEGGRAVGAEIQQGDQVRTLRAEREVVLSAGALGSAHLLLLSGIGEGRSLQAMGIPVVTDLPGVGHNLQNHLDVAVSHTCPLPVSLHSRLRADRIALAMARAYLMGTGPATRFPCECGGFIRTRRDEPLSDLALLFVESASLEAGIWVVDPFRRRRSGAGGDGFTCRVALMRPRSRGRVYLRSPEPRAPPGFDPAYLSEAEDLDVLVRGVDLYRRLVGQSPFDPYRGEEVTPGPDVQTEAEVRDWIRTAADHQCHPVGTCSMGSGPEAVVDASLLVRGVMGLRVADASVMPTIPGAHMHATTVVIAERASDLILGRSPPAPDPQL
jgi:choline dehydrogenase